MKDNRVLPETLSSGIRNGLVFEKNLFWNFLHDILLSISFCYTIIGWLKVWWVAWSWSCGDRDLLAWPFPLTLNSGDSALPALQRAYPRLLVRCSPLAHGPPGEVIFDFTCPKLAPQAWGAPRPRIWIPSLGLLTLYYTMFWWPSFHSFIHQTFEHPL